MFPRPAKSQSKWYGLFSDHKVHPSAVSSWSTDPSKLNSSYSRIARHTGLASTPPASRRLSQETLRRWEKSTRGASVICNQAASFNHCLFKIQQNMQEHLKVLRAEIKGKGLNKGSSAADELQYLMNFNSSITQAAAKSMEHLSEFVFISMGNLTLVRRDAYLSHLRTGIKPDTFTALRTAPLHIPTLFPDSAIKRAEGRRVGTTHMSVRIRGRLTEIQGRINQLGRLSTGDSPRKQSSPQRQTIDIILYKFKYKASCCNKCSYCARAVPKERTKSRVSRLLLQILQIKVCEKCFLCHSIVLCSTCNKCKKYCLKSACRGQISKLLANLAGSGCRSESSSNPERGLHPPLSDPAKSHKVSHSHKLLCQSPQERLPAGGITSAYRQKHSRSGPKSNIF